MLRVNDDLSIPLSELKFRAVRAGGPGGQHVNTSSTRVQLEFDVIASPSLNDSRRARILEKLGHRIDSEGVLRLTSAVSRSQHQNREDVTARLARMLADALRVRKPRRPTKVPRASREERLRRKKRRSETKKLRGPVPDE